MLCCIAHYSCIFPALLNSLPFITCMTLHPSLAHPFQRFLYYLFYPRSVRFLDIRNTNKCSLPARRCRMVSVAIPHFDNFSEISEMLFCFIATR